MDRKGRWFDISCKEKKSKKKLNIVFLIFNTKHNGGNRVIFEHANRLYLKKHSVYILTVFGKNPDWFPLKVRVYSIFSRMTLRYYDILIATFWITVYISILIRAKRKIYWVQGWEEELYSNWLLRKLAKFAHRFKREKIAVSNFVHKKILEFEKSKIPIIPSIGIDRKIFTPRLKPPSKTVSVLSVISRYQYYKGADLLVKAVKEIKKRYPSYIFTLVSYENHPPSDIFDQFFSNPSQKKLIDLYHSSDVLLITSRSEGLFIPGLEALSCGCLVISTNCGGVLDYAIHNKNAYIISSLSDLWKEDLIRKIVYSNKQKVYLENSSNILKRYSWDKIITQFENVLLNDEK